MAHQVGQLCRQLRQRKCGVEHVRTDEDHEDHAAGLCGGADGGHKLAAVQLAACERDAAGQHHTDGRAFSSSEQAAVDAAKHHHKDHHNRPDAAGAGPDFRSACRLCRRRMLGLQAHDDSNGQQVTDGGQQSRHIGGEEHLGDVLFGQDGIHHQRDGRRQQHTHGAAGGQRGSSQAARVTNTPHLRIRHLGDGGRGGHRGARDGSKCCAGQHTGHGHATPEATEQCVGEIEQRFGKAALHGKSPHQHEQRNDRQVVHRHAAIHRALEVCQQGQPARQAEVTKGTRHKHGDGDRHTHGHQHQHEPEHGQPDSKTAHAATPNGRPAAIRTHCTTPISTHSAKPGSISM